MATITAGMVKQLRDKTGAGMMECKAALSEAQGDLDEAMTLLRKRGLAQAALRAVEIRADVILKGTKVDGIYSADPVLHPDATKFPSITYQQVLTLELKVMDAAAISVCKENALPIVVFNLREAGNIRRVVMGEPIGTTVVASAPPAVPAVAPAH